MSAFRITALGATALVVLLVGSGLESSQASRGEVRSCRPFTLAHFNDEYGSRRFRAWDIKRSSQLPCSMVRRLLKAAYGIGPLKVIRKVYPPGGSGRPIYWFKNGWRCGNGAGGASCFNEERPIFNVIDVGATTFQAVTASTG